MIDVTQLGGKMHVTGFSVFHTEVTVSIDLKQVNSRPKQFPFHNKIYSRVHNSVLFL